MPLLTREFKREALQGIYFLLLEDAANSAKWLRELIVDFSYKGEDVPGYAKHGATKHLVHYLTQKAGLSDTNRGGEMYDFYLHLRPLPRFKGAEPELQNQEEMVVMSERVLHGVVKILRDRGLMGKLPGLEAFCNNALSRFSDRRVYKHHELPPEQEEVMMRNLKKMLSSDRFPEDFFGTVWKVYERTDSGICVSYLRFQQIGNLVNVNYATAYNSMEVEKEFTYTGLAGTDEGRQYLVMILFRDQKPFTPLVLTIPLDSYNSERQMAGIGHQTYYTIRFRKYVTKVAVAERLGVMDALPKPHEVMKGTPEYNEISPYIRRYLLSRVHNRLSMPDKIITAIEASENVTTLKSWMYEKLPLHEKDARMKASYGEYALRYYDKAGVLKCFDVEIIPEDPSLVDFSSPTICKLRFSNAIFSGPLLIVANTLLQTTMMAESENNEKVKSPTLLGQIAMNIKLPVTLSEDDFGRQVHSLPMYGFIMGTPDPIGNNPMAHFCMMLDRSKEPTAKMLQHLKEGIEK